jgi:ketosteroid isomerase-like protein
MKKLFMVLQLVLLLCFTFGCQQGEEVAEEPVVDVEAEVEAIKVWFDQYLSSVNAGDVDNLIALYAENTVILPSNGSIVEGRDAFRQWISEWFVRYDAEENMAIQEIEILGKHAFVRGSYDYRNIHMENGSIREGKGKFINLYKLHSDGMWKCTHNIWTEERNLN